MPEFRFSGTLDGVPSDLRPGDARIGTALTAAPVSVNGQVKTVKEALENPVSGIADVPGLEQSLAEISSTVGEAKSELTAELLAKAPAEFETAPGVLRDLVTAVKEIRTLRSFDVVGDGIADDTVKVQEAFTYMRNGGHVIDTIGLKCRITDEIIAHPTQAYRFCGAGRGRTVFLIDFSGFDKVGLKLTHPTNPLQRGDTCNLSHFSIWYGNSVVQAPCALEYRSCSAFFLSDVSIDQWSSYMHRGTSMRLTGVWNSVIRSVSIWAGGCFRSAKLIPTGTGFYTNTSEAKIFSTTPVFSSSDVGKAIQIFDGVNGEQFIIYSAAGDGLSATVDHVPTYALSSTNTRGAFDGVKVTGSNAGSNVIQINGGGAVTSADIGRVVYLALGGGVNRHFRAKITEVGAPTGEYQTIAFDKPLTTTVSEQYLIFSPVFELYTEANNERINDIVFDDVAMEAGAGVQLVIADGVNIRTTQFKLHALNPGYWAGELGTTHHCTLAAAAFFNANAHFVVEAEGTHVNKFGQIWINNMYGSFHLAEKAGYLTAGQKVVSLRGHHRWAQVHLGHIKNDAYCPPYLPLVDRDGTGCGVYHYGSFKDTIGRPRKLDVMLFQLGMDMAKSLNLNCSRGRLHIWNATALNRACIIDFFFDGTNSGTYQVTNNSLIGVNNVALTGTTGGAASENKIVVSVDPAGNLHIQNRLSSYEECHVKVEMGLFG